VRGPGETALACFISDLHLSLTAPAARAAEPNWLDAQARPFAEFQKIRSDYGCPPVFCCGDIFDKWNAPPELINWAVHHLPDMYAIPGQHDLPFHNMDLIEKSAFWTLIQTGTITPFPTQTNGILFDRQGLVVLGFPFGEEVRPQKREDNKEWIRVALTHQFLWGSERHAYPGAPESGRVIRHPEFANWDFVFAGDNHCGFFSNSTSHGKVVNCGCFQRRSIKEQHYFPQVHFLMANRKIHSVNMDVQGEQWSATVEEIVPSHDFTSFLASLHNTASDAIDYNDAIRRAADNCGNDLVARKLLESIGETNGKFIS